MQASSPPPGPPPPRIVNDGHRVLATDFFQPESFWDQAKLSWLDCHLGYLRLFYIGHPVPQHVWSFSEICILTRGRGPGGIEMLELYFPSAVDHRTPLSVYLYRWQCNRFPSWQPGKRCWELEVYCGCTFTDHCSVFFRRRVFFREGKIPCREWWDGPRPDGLPHQLKKPLTWDEEQAKLLAQRESPPQPMPPDQLPKKKPKGRFLTEKEIDRRRLRKRDRDERKRLG